MSALICALAMYAFPGSIKASIRETNLSKSETSCPFCGLDAVRDTPQQDNTVTLTSGSKKQSYRCILCALAGADDFKGDLSITTPSSHKGHPVTVLRKNGVWSTTPETAVFVYAVGDHVDCQIRYRALEDKSDFDDYVQTQPKLLSHAKLLSLQDLLAKAK